MGAVVRRRRLAILGVVILLFNSILSARAECLCECLNACQGAGAPLPTKHPRRGPRSLFFRRKKMPPKFRICHQNSACGSWHVLFLKCALLDSRPFSGFWCSGGLAGACHLARYGRFTTNHHHHHRLNSACAQLCKLKRANPSRSRKAVSV